MSAARVLSFVPLTTEERRTREAERILGHGVLRDGNDAASLLVQRVAAMAHLRSTQVAVGAVLDVLEADARGRHA
jgi:hypothetical protein